MKKIYSIAITILLTASVFAQAPQKMSFQAVIRNGSNALVISTKVGMQISILKGSVSGTAVYVETQNPTTNQFGLVSIEIGTGTPVTGTFEAIKWVKGPYFIKTETDLLGGTNYTILGTNELMSVPYALYSGNGIQSGTTTGQMNYWNGSAWVTIPPGLEGQGLNFCGGIPTWGPCPPPFPQGTVHCTNTPTSVVPVTNPTTGKIWMDRNLGATQVATSSTDAASYGDLYQWGRGADGHQCRTSAISSTLSTTDAPGNANFITNNSGNYDWRSTQNNSLWQGVNGVNNPCPSGYRIPTETELNAEIVSWSPNNSVGAFASVLKLSSAGARDNGGSVYNYDGSYGHYWTSIIVGADSRYLKFHNGIAGMSQLNRGYGCSVRCIKD